MEYGLLVCGLAFAGSGHFVVYLLNYDQAIATVAENKFCSEQGVWYPKSAQ